MLNINNLKSIFLINFNDVSNEWQINFQDSATMYMSRLTDLHHDVLFYLIVITITVLWLLLRGVCNFITTNKLNHIQRIERTHDSLLEIIWTLIPIIILLGISLPAFALLFSMQELDLENNKPFMTIKITGNQWWWLYEFSDIVGSDDTIEWHAQFKKNKLSDLLSGNNSILGALSLADYDFQNFNGSISSNMLTDSEVESSLTRNFRLLEVDNRLTVPTQQVIRILVTSSDVLHSWAVPSLGIKLDACPGRLNEWRFEVERAGVFYGQCSEICGVLHGFMPIVVEALNFESGSIGVEDMSNYLQNLDQSDNTTWEEGLSIEEKQAINEIKLF